MNHGIALRTLAPLIAQGEREELAPPESLTGDALALFQAVARGHASRAWSAAHVPALADYCRVTVMWGENMAEVEREGALVGNKPNPRLRVCSTLSAERLRLARLLGIATMRTGQIVGGSRYTESKLRELGASMANATAQDEHGYLS